MGNDIATATHILSHLDSAAPDAPSAIWEAERAEVERLLDVDAGLALLWSNYVIEWCRLHAEGGCDAVWSAVDSRRDDPPTWLRVCYESSSQWWTVLAASRAMPPVPQIGLLISDLELEF